MTSPHDHFASRDVVSHPAVVAVRRLLARQSELQARAKGGVITPGEQSELGRVVAQAQAATLVANLCLTGADLADLAAATAHVAPHQRRRRRRAERHDERHPLVVLTLAALDDLMTRQTAIRAARGKAAPPLGLQTDAALMMLLRQQGAVDALMEACRIMAAYGVGPIAPEDLSELTAAVAARQDVTPSGAEPTGVRCWCLCQTGAPCGGCGHPGCAMLRPGWADRA